MIFVDNEIPHRNYKYKKIHKCIILGIMTILVKILGVKLQFFEFFSLPVPFMKKYDQEVNVDLEKLYNIYLLTFLRIILHFRRAALQIRARSPPAS